MIRKQCPPGQMTGVLERSPLCGKPEGHPFAFPGSCSSRNNVREPL
jgi:hypothetical protein